MTATLSPYMAFLRSRVGNALVIMPSVSAVIFDGDGRLLLVRHSEGNNWVLPGGAVEPNEPPEEAVVREVQEETGLAVQTRSIVGVYGGPDFEVTYGNGDRVSYVNTLYHCTAERHDPVPDGDEVLETAYVAFADMNGLELARWLPKVMPDIAAARESGRPVASGKP